ncbi:hypothetical protein Bca4012_065091 [Brassica carinata]
MEFLENRGMPIPRQLKDLLTTNGTSFKKEVDEVVVESITERDLVLSPPRADLLRDLNQFGSNSHVVDSATAAAPRSPIHGSEDRIVTQASVAAHRTTTAVSEDHIGALGEPLEFAPVASNQEDATEDRETGTAGMAIIASLDLSFVGNSPLGRLVDRRILAAGRRERSNDQSSACLVNQTSLVSIVRLLQSHLGWDPSMTGRERCSVARDRSPCKPKPVFNWNDIKSYGKTFGRMMCNHSSRSKVMYKRSHDASVSTPVHISGTEFGSTFGTVDSAAVVAIRSPILHGKSLITALD